MFQSVPHRNCEKSSIPKSTPELEARRSIAVNEGDELEFPAEIIAEYLFSVSLSHLT